MTKFLLIAFILLNLYPVITPKGIDYEDKLLVKEIEKVSGLEYEKWVELKTNDQQLNSSLALGKFIVVQNISNSSAQKYAYIGRVNSCRQGGCSSKPANLTVETPEYFDYLIIFDSKPSVIHVKVFNYEATHGQEISTKGWLKQFVGYDGAKNLVLGKSIDGISGATVSATGITTDIQEKTKLLKKILNTN